MKKWAIIAIALGAFGWQGASASDAAKPTLAFQIGVYAASDEVRRAWECNDTVAHIEAVMERELARKVALDLQTSNDYDAGVRDMLSGKVQFGRFPNIDAKWVLHQHIGEKIAQAWLAALREVNPEGRVDQGHTAGGDAGCHLQVAFQ